MTEEWFSSEAELLLTETLLSGELKQMAVATFGNLVKAVVDIDRDVSVLTALFYHKLNNIFQRDYSDENRMLKIKIVNSLIILIVLFSVYKYVKYNSDNNESFKNIGKEIARLANKNEVVFIKAEKFYIDPQIVFYAHRNIASWEGYSKAKELLDLNNVARAAIFSLSDKNDRIISKEYLTSDIDTRQHKNSS